MATKPSGDTLHKKYVIVDTCVIQFAGHNNKFKAEAVQNCLKELAQKGFSLAISEVTVHENLHGLWGKKAIEASSLLDTYEQKVVSKKIFILASVIGGIYKEEKNEGPNMADKIIAATAILENGFVLTENHRDFPNPTFAMETFLPLNYNEGHHFRTLDLALYRPNYEFINREINKLDEQVQ